MTATSVFSRKLALLKSAEATLRPKGGVRRAPVQRQQQRGYVPPLAFDLCVRWHQQWRVYRWEWQCTMRAAGPARHEREQHRGAERGSGEFDFIAKTDITLLRRHLPKRWTPAQLAAHLNTTGTPEAVTWAATRNVGARAFIQSEGEDGDDDVIGWAVRPHAHGHVQAQGTGSGGNENGRALPVRPESASAYGYGCTKAHVDALDLGATVRVPIPPSLLVGQA
ncbi:hypothetical protein K438DRAFT_1978214 [Mycena galopus ATCC 62051]|nr:hypothetical protein K438DRAFT_1978214 [Mycena galopus ATCC 62051]